jgi:arylsulfatase A-like enzyme
MIARGLRSVFALVLVLTIAAACIKQPPDAQKESGDSQAADGPRRRPNILLIVADDLGYADLGIYGGEIETPNLDTLAREGVRFTQFYASPMCSTTRAMLLTGIDHHRAGFGNLVERLSDNQKGQPGYEGFLNLRVATIAEILQNVGYRTYMTGKWHLGSRPGQDPSRRGFDRSFVLLESGAGHFENMLPLLGPGKAEYSEDGARLDTLPEGFYSSRFYAHQMLEYLQTDGDDDKPFFAYLAFTAPHFPLQAPRESIEKYQGKYDGGYDAIHAARIQRMQKMSLLNEDIVAFPRLTSETAWSALSAEEKRSQARLMEIYAAMVDDLDTYVGEIVAYLKAHDLYDNTAIFFLSDNGAEGHYLRWGLNPLVPWPGQCCDNSFSNMGNADSYLMLGPDWARVSVAPLRMFKGFVSEGGIRVPAFVHFPAQITGGTTNRTVVTVKDVMPTMLALAGVDHSGDSFNGRQILPVQGRSMLAMLKGRADSVHGENFAMGWELFGKRAVRTGDWKILWEPDDVKWWDSEALNIKRNTWQLYDLASDPAELNDVSETYPDRLDELIRLWDRYAKDNAVIIPDKQRGY